MIFCFVFFGTELFSAPATITFQARIVKPDLTNLESSNVAFRFLYLYPKPASGPDAQCVIYVEDITGVNMTGSKGLVTLQMGSGVKAYGNGNLKNVFDNSTASYACQSGGTYTPAVNDNRRVIVQFNDGSGTQTLPASELTAVPFAMQSYNSQRLGNNLATDFLKFTDFTGTCAAGEYLKYDSSASPKFSCATPTGTGTGIVNSIAPGTGPLLMSGTSADVTISIPQATASTDGYLSSADFTTFNSKLSAATLLSSDITGKLGYTPAASNDSRFTDQRTPINDSVTSAKILDGTITAADLGSMGASTGQVMKWNGSAWVASSDDTGAVTSVSASPPLSSTGGNTPTISLAKSNSTTDGYLSSADFTTFAAKLSDFSTLVSSDITGKLGYTPVNPSTLGTASLLNSGDVVLVSNMPANCNAGQTLTFSSPTGSWVCSNIVLGNNAVTSAMISSVDWTKVVNAPSTAAGYGIAKATVSTDGYLSSSDFTTFAAKLSDFSSLLSSDITSKLGYTPANANSAWSLNASGDVSRTTGNVGIGTSSPGTVLDTNGGMVRVRGGANYGLYPTTGKGMEFGYDTTADNAFIASYNRDTTAYKTMLIDASSLWLNGFSNGNVSIGNASPQELLHVGNGNNKFALFNFNNPTSAPASNLGLIIGVNNSNGGSEANLWNGFEAATTSFDFKQKTGAATFSTLMTLKPNGNVGIGTQAPGATLDVNGIAKIGGGAAGGYGLEINRSDSATLRLTNSAAPVVGNMALIYLAANNSTPTLANYAYTGMYADVTTAGAQSGSYVIGGYNAGASRELMRLVGSSGNVGIGTTTPVAKLDVSGTIRPGSAGIVSGGACTGEGSFAYDLTAHVPVYCNSSSVWATFGGSSGGLGVAQTWQDVTASRSLGVTYTNSTGKPITIQILGYSGGAGGGYVYGVVDGGTTIPMGNWYTSGGSYPFSGTLIVPVGSTYVINYSITAGSPSLNKWVELR